VSGVWGIVLAGGSGERFGGPKQHEVLGGRSLLQRSIDTLSGSCDGVVLVLPVLPSPALPQAFLPSAVVRPHPGGRLLTVAGGASRADSVRCGLAAIPASAGIVVVADAAHPLATPSLVELLVAQVRAGADGAVPGLPLTEVIGKVSPDGVLAGSLPRAGHVLVQTPHAFRGDLLRRAHATGADAVEDSAMVAALDVDGRPARVVVVPGEPANLHVTTPAELALARRLV
jgi:2-C-methyl-D-erythritol 4-phosphate cytidylyltransferase